MDKAAEWIEDALGAVKESGDPKAMAIIEACGRGCAERKKHIAAMEALHEKASHCVTRSDYVKFLNETLPVKFIEVDDGIEMHLGKTECSCPISKLITKNKEMLCHCTQGENRAIWSIFFGKPVDTEIVESFLRGGNDCVIKFKI